MVNRSIDGIWQKAGIKLSLQRLVTSRRVWSAMVQASVMMGIFVGVMALLQFSTPDMPDNDGYYHIKLAYLMRTQGLRPEFPWLPLTILNAREFSDHHFLFHVALIPFTFGDLRTGAKWAAAIFAGLAFVSIWWLLRGQRVPHSALWAFGLLAVSEAFLFRMSITRAQSLSLAVLALGLHWLLSKEHRRLLPLAFLYVWLYDAFPLLVLLAILYILAVWVVERRLDLRPMMFVAVGILLGLLINPYFPDNLVFFIRHLMPKLSAATVVSVGSEWYPYQTSQLLENSPLALVAFLAGIIAMGMRDKRMDTRTATSLLVAILFGTMLFQSRRFIEYFPAFCLVFAAFAVASFYEGPESTTVQAERKARSLFQDPKWILPAVLGSVLVIGFWYTLPSTARSLARSKSYAFYSGSAAWLEGNTPAGARVFQTDWDDFPRLFYYNTHNTYLVGLDPTYMQLYDASLYDLWVDITQGDIPRPSSAIYWEFGSSYVHTDLNHEGFVRQAKQDPGLEQVYQDSDSIVYRVIESSVTR